jgi:hypothetical protein
MEQQELIEKIKRLPQDRSLKLRILWTPWRGGANLTLDRMSLHQALTNYAIQYAGTDADFDPDLEAAASDHLLQQDSEHWATT